MTEENNFTNFYRTENVLKLLLYARSALRQLFQRAASKGDLLHVAFDSGLSQSVYNARVFRGGKAKKEFPKRRIVVIDSTSGCLGYGIFVDILADMRDEGKSFDIIYDWARANRTKVQHQFFPPL